MHGIQLDNSNLLAASLNETADRSICPSLELYRGGDLGLRVRPERCTLLGMSCNTACVEDNMGSLAQVGRVLSAEGTRSPLCSIVTYRKGEGRDLPSKRRTYQWLGCREYQIGDNAREGNASQGRRLHRIEHGVKEHRRC